MSSGTRRATAIAAGAVAPNSLMGLHLAFRERLAAVVAQFALFETKDRGVTRAPAVIGGWVPPKPGGNAEQFPFVIVRPSDGEDSWEGADQVGMMAIKLIIGTYSDDDDGWLDVNLVIDAIRSDLGERPTLDGTAFEHLGPLKWAIPEQQPRPQWFGFITTNWNVSRPRRVEALYPEQEG